MHAAHTRERPSAIASAVAHSRAHAHAQAHAQALARAPSAAASRSRETRFQESGGPGRNSSSRSLELDEDAMQEGDADAELLEMRRAAMSQFNCIRASQGGGAAEKEGGDDDAERESGSEAD